MVAGFSLVDDSRYSSPVEVSAELLERYKAALAEFEAVQKVLREMYEETEI